MTTSHTPGPWGISSQSPRIIKQYDALGETNVIIGSASSYPQSGFFPSDELAIKNALLFAAAPGLLEVAHQALAFIGAMPHGDNCFVSSHYEGDPGNRCNCGKDSAIDALDTAINKATGA